MGRDTTRGSDVRAGRWASGLLLAALAACGSGTSGPVGDPDALTESLVTEHYVFRFSPGDAIEADWQEAYHDWLHDALELPPTPRVEYRKYRDLDHLRRRTGMDANAWADPAGRVLHTIWERDNHEIVHIVVGHHLGAPPGVFGEGVAVAHQVNPQWADQPPVWARRPVHEVAREIDAEGVLPDLDSMIESEVFNALDSEIRYPVSGSFVRFLIDELGLSAFKELARTSGAHDSENEIRTDFERIYGVSLEEAWERWRSFLRSGPGPGMASRSVSTRFGDDPRRLRGRLRRPDRTGVGEMGRRSP